MRSSIKPNRAVFSEPYYVRGEPYTPGAIGKQAGALSRQSFWHNTACGPTGRCNYPRLELNTTYRLHGQNKRCVFFWCSTSIARSCTVPRTQMTTVSYRIFFRIFTEFYRIMQYLLLGSTIPY